jgi:hypothetical protein
LDSSAFFGWGQAHDNITPVIETCLGLAIDFSGL